MMNWPTFGLNLVFLSITFGTETKEVYYDEGRNVTLHCPGGKEIENGAIQWIVSDVSIKKRLHSSMVQADGSIWIHNVSTSDSHIYSCQDIETNQSLGSVKLIVRTVPPAVTNLSVITHSVYALVTWQIHGDGGYPIERYILQYRISDSVNTTKSKWMVIDDIQPNTSSISIYQLQPNSTYYFRLQAVNKAGASHEVSVMANTKYDPSEIEQAKELLSKEQEESRSLFVRVTVTAVCLVVVTFAILALGISLVLFRNCGRRNAHTELNCETTEAEAEELMELVPHITLNPSFNIEMLEYIQAEEISPTDACEHTSLVQVTNNASKTNGSVQ